jgi:hypothetical protein
MKTSCAERRNLTIKACWERKKMERERTIKLSFLSLDNHTKWFLWVLETAPVCGRLKRDEKSGAGGLAGPTSLGGFAAEGSKDVVSG